ncbi:MAG: enoyl-CoA hydratase [Deltaproteobacteria bacterium CG_4_8_14_3_um_filter_51_11]|nr:enoyl-CoA hydratase/isomerase family protein [bacterium]OIP43873.1 MAG: enoyl-CoA hydratase [Desulfobacteraceae bacterium CG2_30_51_40]PIP45213.1 MAG: enoyl-CoA hydratase [Deltaproteobacteria bacterium CG23_combo_of_CG06-09_8_20_14_all_51_20]PIX19316.1 MAG: enoyl-CoA hydratase [Deltaproteobacteria bacterium CG_4_8_14_3_um_filter_51_11]PIY25681.1 MAG: enoyl-CoA hydratase [Deltaproteobacteria bacterium CG_4_10_14_3_um_filter_51_14]PJB34966.1 MAG: enoyl-CoA hydratase [Deltaproteobacteria bacte
MSDNICLEIQDGVAVFMLNRPDTYNAFDLDMIRTLARELTSIALKKSVKGAVISGNGKAFCAGGDLRWISSHAGGFSAAFHELAASYHQAIVEIRRMPKPVVAAINGLAAGGGFSLALGCDFRVMEAQAVLRQAYTSNGLSIDGGGTFSLPRLVGFARALEIAVFDGAIEAKKALDWGLVTEIAEQGGSVKRAILMVKEISERSLPSFAASKRLLTDSFDTPLEAQLEKERRALALCAATSEGREGVTAFVEKRRPVFTGS